MLIKVRLLRWPLRSLLDVLASTPALRLQRPASYPDLSQHPEKSLGQQSVKGGNMWRKILASERGMTLIEIMVVVTILGLIATIVTVNVLDRLEQAKASATLTQIKNLETALDEFRRDNGFYPATEQGLAALVQKPESGRVPHRYPRNGYLKGGVVPRDSFDCDFVYYSPGLQGNPYEITSLGADCQEGGEDADADIHSYQTTREE